MKRSSRVSLRAILFAAALAAAGPAGATTLTVTVAPGGTMTFSPSSLTINVGDTVSWVWDSSGHSTTSGSPCNADGKWDSAVQTAPFSFNVTFTSAGTYPYFCIPHCEFGMTGQIIVQEPTVTPTPTATATAAPTTTATPPQPTSTPTVAPPTATATRIALGAVPILSPSMLALFALALGGAALLLIKRS